jgi:hypothetical protein
MQRRSTYPMSTLFLLVTVVAVLMAMASSRISEWLNVTRPFNTFEPTIRITVAAAFFGLLGPIVMAYQTSSADLLLLSYFVGVAISGVAVLLFVGPNSIAVAAAGAAIVVAYAVVIRFLQPPRRRDAPSSGGDVEKDMSPKRSRRKPAQL